MMRRQKQRPGASLLVMTAAMLVATTSALAQPFTLSVKKDHLFGSSDGTLTLGPEGLVYETPDSKDARRWSLDDIRQLQVLSPTRITIGTYEDQGWTRLGADRTFAFEVTDGVVSPALVAFLWQSLQAPMVSAVIPAGAGRPRLSVPVKLRRRIRGSQGVLHLYEDRLVYETDHIEHQRAWRFLDLRMVYQPDRQRITVDAYEGGGSRTHAFSFELKQPLPGGFLDAVWQRLQAPSSARISERRDSMNPSPSDRRLVGGAR